MPQIKKSIGRYYFSIISFSWYLKKSTLERGIKVKTCSLALFLCSSPSPKPTHSTASVLSSSGISFRQFSCLSWSIIFFLFLFFYRIIIINIKHAPMSSTQGGKKYLPSISYFTCVHISYTKLWSLSPNSVLL